MQGDERRRASGVHSQCRTIQPQVIGQSSAEKTSRSAGSNVGVQVEERVTGFVLVIVVHPTNEYTSRIPNLFRKPTRPFDRFPCDFEEKTLLWVDPNRFTRRDAKKLRIHLVNGFQVNSFLRIHSSRSIGIFINKGLQIPTRTRDIGNKTFFRQKLFPKLFRRVSGTGKPTSHGDNRNGFGTVLLLFQL